VDIRWTLFYRTENPSVDGSIPRLAPIIPLTQPLADAGATPPSNCSTSTLRQLVTEGKRKSVCLCDFSSASSHFTRYNYLRADSYLGDPNPRQAGRPTRTDPAPQDWRASSLHA